jgi:hypothetical protein
MACLVVMIIGKASPAEEAHALRTTFFLPIGNLCVMSKIKGRKIVCYAAAALGYIVCALEAYIAKERSFGGVGGFAGAQGGGFLCLMRCGLFCAAAAAADHERKTSQAEMPQGGGERKRITGDYGETQLIGINFSTRNSTHIKTPLEVNQQIFALLFWPFCINLTPHKSL